jgi:alanyl-tRNA synthetase
MSERLYYSEPFLASFEAHVVDIREVSRIQGQPLWQISLDRTAFYPTSGGQPHDTGTLIATAPSGTTLRAPILAVEEDDAGEVWHTTAKPLLAGTAIFGEIDWERRRDHMQQHSGQHLLSAAFLRETGAPTVSFHLGESTSTIDLAIESVSAEQLRHIEDTANQVIAENRAVTTRNLSRSEAETLLASGTLRKLPEREGEIRVIDIESFDLTACGGTHVRSTGQIGVLLLRGAERVKQGVRLEFVCGLRAVETARRDWMTLTRAASALSVGLTLVPEAVDRLIAENKIGNKERQKLREDLANYDAARLLVEFPIENGLRIVRRSFAEQDSGYIKLLASRLTASAPQTCAMLGSTAEEPAKVVLASSRDLSVDCGAALRKALAIYGFRGGGAPTMAQGQIPAAELEGLFSTLEAELRKI